eukprot:Blabericola_migrator_1__12339@NODE_772_length_6579_cov_9_106419_g549_i0_p4_GENE_NODE_772_length_6579_cov_9_106419_g549_i0NODE_772_length_6579_cov_9_106419_g549_i0_p4_ORF_typecomplete_len254_score37_59Pinin_SDK_N/PF04697_13/0_34_NODE_772_length_6579_cov_9_106419_g549_i03921153
MNEKIKELDANITKLREMLKNDTKIRATNSGMDSLLNEGSGSMLRSNDQGSPYNGERKRRRTGSDDEDIPGPASYIRSQFRRQDSSSSGEEEKEVPAPFFRPAEQMSPVSKKRHFSFGGPPEIMQPHDGEIRDSCKHLPFSTANPVRGGLGLGASSASGTSHPGLGSVNMDGGDVRQQHEECIVLNGVPLRYSIITEDSAVHDIIRRLPLLFKPKCWARERTTSCATYVISLVTLQSIANSASHDTNGSHFLR